MLKKGIFAMVVITLLFSSYYWRVLDAVAYAVNEPKEKKEARKEPEVIPLRDVMLDLISYYHGIFIGIFMRDQLETAIVASKGIANHVSPSGGLRHYVQKNIERSKEAEKLDKEVQDLADKLAEAFEAKKIEEAVMILNEMNLRCVKCHQFFRK